MIQHQEITQLMAFHGVHFPGQPIPRLTTAQHQAIGEAAAGYVAGNDNDELGYYEDGVKRTLTDEQIKMFRHSEIQRLLSERQASKEKDEAQQRKGKHNSCCPVSRELRKRQFYDEPSTEHPEVETLMYDDQPETLSKPNPAGKKFLWPLLGQRK